MSNLKKIQKRKLDHLQIAASAESQIGDTGFLNYKFIHNPLPESDFDRIDTSTQFLDRIVKYPILISCMSGGIAEGETLNRNLAKAAQKYKIAMGFGSQRIAIEHSALVHLFEMRDVAPDIPLLANIGLVQLNYGFGLKEFQKCVDMVEADALVVHINPIQEVIQPEGNRNWKGLLGKLSKIIDKLSVPVIAKEVGFGLSEDAVKRLYKVGVRYFDTSGWGGTNWAMVEGLRSKSNRELGELFSGWGIPTTESIKMCANFKGSLPDSERSKIKIIGSGGVRNGVDIAKAISLGSDIVGIASPFAKAAMRSVSEVEKLIERYAKELKITMFGVGAESIKKLKKVKLVEQK
ncbi:type 2 isopentenyl-diphosphate Delta-isomerase [Candidatus Woesebacteria bacterium]|nr:type 2 isopentenyl-diphosphate Delta-isomerase [Candidatus Woesebacteria bacterium]